MTVPPPAGDPVDMTQVRPKRMKARELIATLAKKVHPGRQPPDTHDRAIVDAYRQLYPGIRRETALKWYVEDQAFEAFAHDVLAAAHEGVDLAFLRSCPDLTGLAISRQKDRQMAHAESGNDPR